MSIEVVVRLSMIDETSNFVDQGCERSRDGIRYVHNADLEGNVCTGLYARYVRSRHEVRFAIDPVFVPGFCLMAAALIPAPLASKPALQPSQQYSCGSPAA